MPDLIALIFAQPGLAFACSSVSETINSDPRGRMPMILPFGRSRMRIPVTAGGSGGVSFGASSSGGNSKSFRIKSPSTSRLTASRSGGTGTFGSGTSCLSFALSPTR
ncbi:hypothetical protein BDSB_10950 [Burkholderia dolosa PC543]|nr:hypothetical protein BDSB_10950 [Burkholderia dolosa PC543]